MRTTKRAFTLLELIVAVTISAALVGLVLAVTRGTLSVWHSAQDTFALEAQAQLALDLIERDWQAAIHRDDGNMWLAVDLIDSPGLLASHGWLAAPRMKPAGAESDRAAAETIGEARFGVSGAWLRFFTTNVEAAASLPVAVAYQIARRPVSGSVSAANPAAIRYSLFRSVVAPETTFSTGYDLRAGYGSGGVSPGKTRSAATLTNPNTSDALATNAVDFGVWLYTREASGDLRRIYPTDNADVGHAALSAEDFPEVVDVAIRILTDEGATLLDRIEAGDGTMKRPEAFASEAAWWWATVEAHSRVFVRRIEIFGKAP